jgi:serine/threonine protein kinase
MGAGGRTTVGPGGVRVYANQRLVRKHRQAGAMALTSVDFYDGPMDSTIRFVPFAAAERAVGGRFEARQIIGVGGFGPVYRAHFPKAVLDGTLGMGRKREREQQGRRDGAVASDDSGGFSSSPRTPAAHAAAGDGGGGGGGGGGSLPHSPVGETMGEMLSAAAGALRGVFGSGERGNDGGGGGGGGAGEPLVDCERVDCAVKLLNPAGSQGIEQFVSELRIIAMCHHRSLLPLLAAVNEPNRPVCLITPYMENGSLTDVLKDRRKRAAMPWQQRLQIAVGTADALVYLHTPSASKPRVIHRDIKPDNLLLDRRMAVRVADFGLARELLHGADMTQTGTAGTLFYIDPEYQETGELTEASDTYSFGVCLLQLLTGEARAANSKAHPPGLVTRLRPRLADDRSVMALADPEVRWPQPVCVALAALILQCVQRRSGLRPPLVDVLSTLREIVHRYGGAQQQQRGTSGAPSTHQGGQQGESEYV